MCDVASWIPRAVAATLSTDRSAQPILAWLLNIRASTEEYDNLANDQTDPHTADSETPDATTTTDSAFDEILSKLGKEIFQLDEFQRKLVPGETQVSLSILNIFDEWLEKIESDEPKASECCEKNSEEEICETEVMEVLTNGCSENYSDNETVKDEPSETSTPIAKVRTKIDSDPDCVFLKSDSFPIPPPRARLKLSSSSPIVCTPDKQDMTIVGLGPRPSESDSESTCWSYKEGSTDTDPDPQKAYAVVWSHSSGFHNSDEILRKVLLQHHATVSQLSFDEAGEFTPTKYSVYTLHEVGGRCAGDAPEPVGDMTPDKPTECDDGYEPVRDAITDENIYEEIEFGYSYTDEGCSCGGSVEVESCSISASSSCIGRESPLYANLRDNDAYTITPDVIYWKNLLLQPDYNDDEEDEWITPEECAVYSREQRPPLVIPRITQYRAPRKPHNSNIYVEDSALDQGPRHIKQYDRLHDQSPKSERGRVDIERSFSKANSDSPPFVRINKRLGASTENLLVVNGRRPNNLHLPASSSGDSLDVEVRDKEPSLRKRQSRSMMAPNPRVRSPVPAPRQMLAKPEITVDYEGPVKRTRYLESGKKCKKNWTDCYMVLTSTALVFYRDQKTYYASKLPKLPGTPPSPGAARAELVLPLKNAHVVQCIATYTRRFSRSVMLTVGYDQYLIQDDTEEGCRRWLKSIQNIIYSLGPSEDFRSPQYQSSNTDLESLGRTPPVSRHANRNKTKAGGSSNEDLSDSTEVSIQKSHVRSRLRKFFAKRPAMDVLIKKGIYKDEPVFGRNLEEVCPANSPRVPDFVIACVKEIESNEENMCTDGLYRASGNLSQVQKIRLEIDQNNLSVIESSADIHVLTGSLKLFFRELKEPLIPCSMFDRVLAACSLKSREVRIKEFRDIVQALPQCNRDTLKYLLQHLLRVTQYSDHNRMHTANLAIVFGPTLLWAPAEQAHNIAIDCIQQNNVVEILLNDYKDIFVDDPTKGKKKA